MKRGWRAVRHENVRSGDILPGWLLVEALRQGDERAVAARSRAAHRAALLSRIFPRQRRDAGASLRVAG
jgi:hypothetical protein